MDIVKKRDLMIAIETLCVRPGNATEKTISDALTGFQELIKHTTSDAIVVVYACGGGK
ncbi:hypothetical protein GIX10_00140 [Acinetobacter sp. YIM 103518]|uniref:Uncharacterized protein n=1 Tax=Acinetobacter faecalis TaxID=2665161 RepID=A0A6L6GBN6_9GAMM|nr:hypothetical protein [Acinetobacter faecalis]MTD09865.1 hypothetical protein [Acinetobacter faecalis]